MIKRLCESLVHELAAQFPAVLILGPRQCGKTTLARHFLKGEYFDLEKPSDLQVFLGDVELAVRRFDGPLIIDEAQILPDFFPVIRALIDEDRRQNGRFYLLGSVNPSLIKGISESLAGRVGMAELTPFLFKEAMDLEIDLPLNCLKGGYTDAIREKNRARWERWQENFVRTFIERDVPRGGVKISAIQMRRLMGMISHLHGGLLNASELGRSLGVSYHTVSDYLDIIEGHYLIRRLPPYHANIGKRLVKSPKIYIRDTGLLHYLLGVSSERTLFESPKRSSSLEGLMIEQIIAREQLEKAGSQFYFYRTYAGAEIDLIVDRGSERIGYEFKCAVSTSPRDWASLKKAIDDGIIHKGLLIYLGERSYPVSERIELIGTDWG
ncbi:MAG: ATP-binding protein [Deltaproteobacteria bacterium]